uniref:Uncharacterized protein n=1 Tax=Cacopsylla melanoneura TaxID=428564 RepID=A0A8D8ZDL9_9HEMI
MVTWQVSRDWCNTFCRPADQFITHKNALSSSEWTAASIKLNVNYANLAGVPGAQSETRSSNLCRHCNREKEIPSHVLGACPHNENLITARHHRVKNMFWVLVLISKDEITLLPDHLFTLFTIRKLQLKKEEKKCNVTLPHL